MRTSRKVKATPLATAEGLMQVRIVRAWGCPMDVVADYLRQRRLGRVDEHTQRTVDGYLSEVHAGMDARTVFARVPKKRRGERKNVARERALCIECLRLEADFSLTRARAKDQLSAAWGVEIRTIERALKAWEDELVASRALDLYRANLKARADWMEKRQK